MASITPDKRVRHPIHERGPLPPTSGVRLLAPTPTPPPASDGLASASALASDTSDERGSPLPTSDVRRLPRARSTISDKRGLSPRADADAASDDALASASALAPDAHAEDASDEARRRRGRPNPDRVLGRHSGPPGFVHCSGAPGAEDVSTTKLRPMQKHNPFLSHGFLSSLEESHSAMKETGWMPRHIVAKDESGAVIGVVPLYLKRRTLTTVMVQDTIQSTSVVSLLPPVTGPRILLRDSSYKDQVFDIVVDALKNLVAKSQVSSIHITFSSENEWHYLKEKGFLQRIGMQYHWRNRNYTWFNETKKAMVLYQEMLSSNFRPDRALYEVMLRRLRRENDVDNIDKLVKDMEELCCMKPSVICSALVRGECYDHAATMLRLAIGNGHELDRNDLLSILSSYSSSGRHSKGRNLLEFLKEHAGSNALNSEALVVMLCKAGKLDAALKVYSEISAYGSFSGSYIFYESWFNAV
ncbi:hypothetical protein NL676_025048 [Syzygium grande]|nr:hypothetical protein NL676_025048 [Syzygium grande]